MIEVSTKDRRGKWTGQKFDAVLVNDDIFAFDAAYCAVRKNLDSELVKLIRWCGFIDVIVTRTHVPTAGRATHVTQIIQLSRFGKGLLVAMRTEDGPREAVRRFFHDNPPNPVDAFDADQYSDYCRAF